MLTISVDRRALHNDPGAEIDEVNAMFVDDMKQLENELDMLRAWTAKNTSSRSQRWQHCECVVETLKSRAADHTGRFQTALKKRTEVASLTGVPR